MLPNRPARSSNDDQGLSASVAVETLRNAAEPAKAEEKKKEEESIPLFWRVFGGTVFSIISLVTLTAYNGFSASLAEARSSVAALGTDVHKEIARLDEAQGLLTPKDEMAATLAAVGRNLDDLGADHKELAALRQRCAALLAAFKKGEKERAALEAELQEAREEQAADGERRALEAELGKLRERLAAIQGRIGTD